MAVNRFLRADTSTGDYSASLWQIKMTLSASATEDFILPTEDIIDVSWSWDVTEPTIQATTWPIADVDADTAHWDNIVSTDQLNISVTALRFIGGLADTEISINVRVSGV